MNYELYDEAALLSRTEQKTTSDLLKSATDLNSLLPPSRYDSNAPQATAKRHARPVDTENKDIQLKELEFTNCIINKIAVRKFVMKNNSGIRALFTLQSQHYEPVQYLDQVIPPSSPAAGDSRATPMSKRSGFEMSEHSIIYIMIYICVYIYM